MDLIDVSNRYQKKILSNTVQNNNTFKNKSVKRTPMSQSTSSNHLIIFLIITIVLSCNIRASTSFTFIPDHLVTSIIISRTKNMSDLSSPLFSSKQSDDASTTIESKCSNMNLPGDPSLHLFTNVDLGDKKLEVMKACSKTVSEVTGKPEQWVAVMVSDNASIIFAGTDAPAALGNLYSLGAINLSNNEKIQSRVTDILEPFGVDATRMYINFFDMERQNVGWNRATFGS